ncbi:NAD(P)/FAD-dependent oxidoreductase [Spartinivicinus poritis]|uniref:NAD(P)/FAD-dependent oxidoreductase n=1 Tax=Spartinivicinus poritis TaxID=2994640 RepID=A0ABT5U5C7_9GAMM|nr:FAD/NAD(P)-binding protein [Spartinivicinus sp. A2-2]MDE1461507.1 NAD(P)/FAD-dependent oxidoreductase [Spartinivicinus sp. A2-2]
MIDKTGGNEKSIPLFPSNNFESIYDDFQVKGSQAIEHVGEYDIVIVGGGISGLTAAWQVREHYSTLLLDQGNKLGGNACSNQWNDLRFSTAGTCFQKPLLESDVGKLLMDLDLWNKWQETDEDTLVLFNTKELIKNLNEVTKSLLKQPSSLKNPSIYALSKNLVTNLVTKKRYVAAPKKLGDPVFIELFKYLEKFTPSNKHPQLPWHNNCQWSREEMELFDSISLHDLFCNHDIRRTLPKELVPSYKIGSLVINSIETTLRVECLSTKSVSAYVGIYFLVGYLYGTLVAFPGGNGYISEQLERNLSSCKNCTLQSKSKVISITEQDNNYIIRYSQQNQMLEVKAKSVIWAAPKYSAINAIKHIPTNQLQAMKAIKHHDYCIAGVFLNEPIWPDKFGGYLIEDLTSCTDTNIWCKAGTCLVANWQDPGYPDDYGIITLLKPIANSQDQGKLNKIDFKDLQLSVLSEVCDILEAAGQSSQIIKDIKIWRWNQGLVISEIGQIKNNIFNLASSPNKGLFFANQDSIGIGNIESAIYAGNWAATSTIAYLSNHYNNTIPNKQAV